MSYPKISSGEGTTRLVSAFDEPAEFIVQAVPGAVEARAAWQDANAEGVRLTAESRALGLRLRDMRREHAPAAEVEAVEAEARDLEARIRRQTGVSGAALRAFLDVVHEARTADDSLKRLAAREALAAQTDVEEAARVLFARLAERDRAWSVAGSPGVSWQRKTGHNPRGALMLAQQTIEGVVRGFDTRATALAAAGEEHTYGDPDLGGVSAEMAAKGAAMQWHADTYSAQRATR
ncbi:hypothetical protein [Amnibacterium sp.]|uniref:hypothetical protein n=1 Tax=Amnibacterium sp. TaxID=1872496 RepID=UPI003F7C84AE